MRGLPLVTLKELRSFGFTAPEVSEIDRHGWVRHRDSARFENSMLKASKAGYAVTPPSWPNAKDPDSGWYVLAPVRKRG